MPRLPGWLLDTFRGSDQVHDRIVYGELRVIGLLNTSERRSVEHLEHARRLTWFRIFHLNTNAGLGLRDLACEENHVGFHGVQKPTVLT